MTRLTDVKRGQTLNQKLLVSDSDANVISGPLQDKATAAKGHLIVSGSRDQTVRLWDAAQGKVLSIKQLPKRSSRKDKYDPYGPKDRLWLSVCWPVASPGHVISSSQGYVPLKHVYKLYMDLHPRL